MDRKKTPVLVGQAQLAHREKTALQLDPLSMMAEVARMAVKDAGLQNIPRVDTLYVVNCISKVLNEPARDLSKIIGIDPSETGYTAIGATAPQWFVNLAAKKIYSGESEWVLICGAEAFYTSQQLPPMGMSLARYFTDDEASLLASHVGDVRRPLTDIEMRYGLVLPVHIYSLFENALRARKGQSMKEHTDEIASFCAGMSAVASQNRFAWSKKTYTAHDIAAVDGQNRMIAYPYTKRMCANMQVNQAACVLMTSMACAEDAGVPKDKMIFFRGGGEAEDSYFVSERPDLWASPSVAEAVEQALSQVPLTLDEVQYLDLYSCFPVASRITADMLGVSPDNSRPLTVTGGMPYFGGPGNNYAMHAICHMMEILRENPDSFGLVQALSWFISKHCAGLYSAKPGNTTWTPSAAKEKKKYPRVNVLSAFSGEGTIETYCLSCDREGNPEYAVVFGRDNQKNRFLAKVANQDNILEEMLKCEPIGKNGTVVCDESSALNQFYF
jgi:acetyl-CoA C-acetyltransferase